MSTGTSDGGYPVPDEQFNAPERARNKIMRANQFQELVLEQWIATYLDFYGLLESGGSRYTTQEMQLIIDAMPACDSPRHHGGQCSLCCICQHGSTRGNYGQIPVSSVCDERRRAADHGGRFAARMATNTGGVTDGNADC